MGSILGNILIGLGQVIHLFVNLYMWIVIIAALITWVNPDPYNPIVRFLFSVTEPAMRKVRRYIPARFGGIDFTPIIVIAALIFLDFALAQSIIDVGMRMKMGGF